MGEAHNHVAALAVMYWHCNGDMAKLMVLICIHIRDHWGDGNCLMPGQQRVISYTVWSEGSDTTSCEKKKTWFLEWEVAASVRVACGCWCGRWR